MQHTSWTSRVLAAATLAATLALANPGRAEAVTPTLAVTDQISVTTAGAEANVDTGGTERISADGRYVFFDSPAAYQPDDTNGTWDVYRHDRLGGITMRVSVDSDEKQLVGDSQLCGASRNGRFVGFVLTKDDFGKMFVRDTVGGVISLVSVNSAEQLAVAGANGNATYPDWPCPISDNGRYVAFQSGATNLAPDNANGGQDVYRRDRLAGTTEMVSRSSGGVPGNSWSGRPDMSADGDVIVFDGTSTNLVANDALGHNDVFARVMSISATTRISTKFGGGSPSDNAYVATISADGDRVAYESYAKDLVAVDTNNDRDAFLRDRSSGDTTLISTTSNGAGMVGGSAVDAIMSADGQVVVFTANATNLPGGGDGKSRVYRKILGSGATELVSVTGSGGPIGDSAWSTSTSADGSVIGWTTEASAVRNDTNGTLDVFVRELDASMTPYGNFEALWYQQFDDFMGRPPTAAETAAWLTAIRHGEASVDGAIHRLVHDGTWGTKRGPLIRLYWAFFLRAPDMAGMEYWNKKLVGGSTLTSVATQFAKSSEFQTKYGALSNQAFVTKIYQNIFDRDPDAGGLGFWTKRLNEKTKTRGQVMVNFSESSEGKRVLLPQTDGLLEWFAMMRTNIPKATMADYLQQVREDGEPIEIMSQAIRQTDAYSSRVQ